MQLLSHLALSSFQQNFGFGVDVACGGGKCLGVECQCIVELFVDKPFVCLLQNRHRWCGKNESVVKVVQQSLQY